MLDLLDYTENESNNFDLQELFKFYFNISKDNKAKVQDKYFFFQNSPPKTSKIAFVSIFMSCHNTHTVPSLRFEVNPDLLLI